VADAGETGRFDGVRALDGGWLETALADIGLTASYQHGLAETLDEVTAGGFRGRTDSASERCRDRTNRARRLAHAAEVDLLHPEAQDWSRDPLAEVLTSDRPTISQIHKV
jgi:hypothetical protein